MQKGFPVLWLSGLILLVAWSASAVPYQDIDSVNATLSSATPSYTGNFNIVTGDGGAGDLAGYNPASQTIDSGYALFSFLNLLNGSATQMRIDLTSSQLASPTSLSVALGGGLSGQIVLDLNPSGVDDYKVTRSAGMVRLLSAALFVQADSVASVPDAGTTLSLLGVALVVLGVAGRKLKADKPGNLKDQ